MADISVTNQGSTVGIQPLTDAGKTWITDNVPTEDWQWLGNILYVEPRYAPPIVEGMQADGLEVI